MALKATTVSIRNLSAAVTKAVNDLGDRGKGLDPEFTIDHNLIWGRILRESLQIQQAEALAQNITHNVQAAHGLGAAATGAAATGAAAGGAGNLQPAVLASNGRIIVGFILDRQISLHE